MTQVDLLHLDKTYDNGHPAVQDVTLHVPSGKITALLGPSGCGKTTTLKMIAGLLEPTRGDILFGGDSVLHLPAEKRTAVMAFQNHLLFPYMSVGENVGFGLKMRGENKATRHKRVADLLELVQLAGYADRRPNQLSGGQQQRVALARALITEPEVLLLDEPLSNLDAHLREEMRTLILNLQRQLGITTIFVTHDQEEALFMGDQVAVMNGGRIEQLGTPEAIFHQPQTRFVAEFIGQTDFLPGAVTREGVETALGMLPQQLSVATGTAVEIALRADDVLLEPDENGRGRILSRQFVGIAYIYKVGLPDGTIVHSWQPHSSRLAIDSCVRVSLTDAHALSCFVSGQAL
ncbi:MAG: ABC transporter ATP-binding protein [Anaerolineales bacterium]|nr:ABC transporter ATP-binding protein [Anaerolineales bacterium]